MMRTRERMCWPIAICLLLLAVQGVARRTIGPVEARFENPVRERAVFDLDIPGRLRIRIGTIGL